jgi:hypothetical protein
MTSVHALKAGDGVKRAEYCRRFRDGITANGEDMLHVTSLTDETCFHLSGYVNNQNSHVWLATNPHEIKDTPLHDPKVGVWIVISRTRIISPLFFDDVISWERYYEVVLYPFMGHLNEEEITRSYSLQDGAIPHTACVSVTLLRDVLGDRIISKDIWPPWSPDLRPPD